MWHISAFLPSFWRLAPIDLDERRTWSVSAYFSSLGKDLVISRRLASPVRSRRYAISSCRRFDLRLCDGELLLSRSSVAVCCRPSIPLLQSLTSLLCPLGRRNGATRRVCRGRSRRGGRGGWGGLGRMGLCQPGFGRGRQVLVVLEVQFQVIDGGIPLFPNHFCSYGDLRSEGGSAEMEGLQSLFGQVLDRFPHDQVVGAGAESSSTVEAPNLKMACVPK